MRKLLADKRFAAIATVAGLGLATAAIGLPWDIDMADSQGHKAYEVPMKGIAEGAIAQPDIRSPIGYTPNYERTSPEGMALTSPLANDEATLAQGEKMYNTYCTPCHGDGENLGPVAQPGRFPGVVALSGAGGVSKSRTDGWIYLTIRNGGAIMPYYSWAMSDAEMWSIVHYVRTLPGAAYVPPAPPAETEASP